MTYSNAADWTPLTTEKLADLVSDLWRRHSLIYAVSEQVSPGKVLVFKETETNYEYMVFHSEDEAQAVADRFDKRLLHVRDAPSKLLDTLRKANTK